MAFPKINFRQRDLDSSVRKVLSFFHNFSNRSFAEECRIRYVQTSSRIEQIYARLREIVASGVSSAEETLGQILELLSGVEKRAEGKTRDAGEKLSEKKGEAEKKAEKAKADAKAKKSEL